MEIRSLDRLLVWYMSQNGIEMAVPLWDIQPADNLYGATIIDWIASIPQPDEEELAVLEAQFVETGGRADFEAATEEIAFSQLTSATAPLFAQSLEAVETVNRLEVLFTNERFRSVAALESAWTRLVGVIKASEAATANDPEPFVMPPVIIEAWNAMAERNLFPSFLYYPVA